MSFDNVQLYISIIPVHSKVVWKISLLEVRQDRHCSRWKHSKSLRNDRGALLKLRTDKYLGTNYKYKNNLYNNMYKKCIIWYEVTKPHFNVEKRCWSTPLNALSRFY